MNNYILLHVNKFQSKKNSETFYLLSLGYKSSNGFFNCIQKFVNEKQYKDLEIDNLFTYDLFAEHKNVEVLFSAKGSIVSIKEI